MELLKCDKTSKFEPPPPDKTPWLVYSDPSGLQYFCTTSPLLPSENKSYYTKRIIHLYPTSIIGSCFDWLILQNHNNKRLFSLYNPVTSQAIQHLPPLEYLTHDYSSKVFAALTLPPICNGYPTTCVLFLFSDAKIFICRPMMRSPHWICLNTEVYGEAVDLMYPVSLNGYIYCWATTSTTNHHQGDNRSKYFLIIKINDDDSVSLRVESCTNLSCFGGFLLESCGRIYSVRAPLHKIKYKKIEVWELDLYKMNWIEVNWLDGRAFFLSPNGSAWCWGSKDKHNGILENCVYITLRKSTFTDVYSYKLGDSCFELFRPFLCLETWGNNWPVWLMPERQRLIAGTERAKVEEIFVRVENILNSLVIDTEAEKRAKQAQENYLSQLPLDIAGLIINKLHLFDYWNLRVTCKMFRATFPVVPYYHWLGLGALPMALFFYFKKDDSLCEVKDPYRSGSHSITLGLSRDHFTIPYTNNGWLLILSNDKNSLEFVNPFTKIRRSLPPNKDLPNFSCMGFSTNPTSPDCVTVGFSSSKGSDYIYYLCNGDETWKRYNIGNMMFFEQPKNLVYHKGAFYFMDILGYLGIFKLVDGKKENWRFLSTYLIDNNWIYRSYMTSSHLLECNGELISVLTNEKGKSVFYGVVRNGVAAVKVFKFNEMGENWSEIKSLGDYCLFIGPKSSSSSFSVVARDQSMKNRIYFSRLKENEIVYYSLETGKFHSIGSENSFEGFCTSIPLFGCCWLKCI